MVQTFDALAKFGEDGEPKNNSTDPQTGNTASVDLSAVINRLNELETAINDIRKEQQAETKPDPQTPNQTADPQSEPTTTDPQNNGNNSD